MIVDGHNYCVPQLDAPQGYPSLEDKMRQVQSEFSGHHQPVWRIPDRAEADNSTLIDLETGFLKKVEWTREQGRLAWKIDGNTYTKQYLPPMINNLEFHSDSLIREMDYANVDIGLLHAYRLLGSPKFLNKYLRESTNSFPERLYRLVLTEESQIVNDPDRMIQDLFDAVNGGGAVGLQYYPALYYDSISNTSTPEQPWDDGLMRPFWEAVSSINLPVYFTLIGGRGALSYQNTWQQSYLDEQRILMRWMERYPNLPAVITHGLPWTAFLENEQIKFPSEIWEVFESPQCHLQLLIPIQMGARWDYPWKESEPAMEECATKIGADRLIWGTDMPMVARFCTYKQALNQFTKHCDFLSEQDRSQILGGTAHKLIKSGLQDP